MNLKRNPASLFRAMGELQACANRLGAECQGEAGPKDDESGTFHGPSPAGRVSCRFESEAHALARCACSEHSAPGCHKVPPAWGRCALR